MKYNRKLSDTMKIYLFCLVSFLLLGCKSKQNPTTAQKTNVILIYTDDLGYGDLSVYGGKIPTPHIDRLADNGILHTNAYATASTCTPSRYSLLTGEYAWRQKGRGVVNADASALIPSGRQTIASIFKKAGYKTAVIGKWHLGLGNKDSIAWNSTLQNTPNDIGFDYSFIMPATSDRVPCVYIENRKVVGLDPKDPIRINYSQKIGDFPTGKENPELLKLAYSHGHDMTIINGISRIGYQQGGKSALWKDENIADDFIKQSKQFITQNKSNPFFLYLATNNIHVPRMPHARFQGKSGYGLRGDAILELDNMVKEITETLETLGLAHNTIIIFSSDNGAVLDDGYADEAVEKIGNHNPFAQLRGGKYSSYEAGTRVPFIVSWKGKLYKQTSKALVSQVDLLASVSEFLGVSFNSNQAMDTQPHWNTWIGKETTNRSEIIQEAIQNVLSIVQGDYKYIEPAPNKPQKAWQTGIETGFSAEVQLYNLKTDPKETKNIAHEYPHIVRELQQKLHAIRNTSAQ